MLFDRRNPAGLREKLRVAVWPRRTWGRSVSYVLKRLMRLRASSHAIAVGAAAGVLVSCTPFLGLHFILAGLLAYALRGSIVASALGTFFANPITFPFIWLGSYQLGSLMLGVDQAFDAEGLAGQLKQLSAYIWQASWDAVWTSLQILWPVMLAPMIVGGVVLGLLAGGLSYYPVRKLAGAQQHRRGAILSS